MQSDSPALLDAVTVLSGGFGRYWQFTTSRVNRGAPDPEAIYVRLADVKGLRSVLEDKVRWFIPHGTSHIQPDEVTSMVRALTQLGRMPDEGARQRVWLALAQWLDDRATSTVLVRMQVFR